MRVEMGLNIRDMRVRVGVGVNIRYMRVGVGGNIRENIITPTLIKSLEV
jgi:hypothetical protein